MSKRPPHVWHTAPCVLAVIAALLPACSSTTARTEAGVAQDVGGPGDALGLDAMVVADAGVGDGTLMDSATDDASNADAPGATDTGIMLDTGHDATGSMDALAVDAASDALTEAGADVAADVPIVLPPRLLAPLSGGRTSNRRPMLRWVPPSTATQFRVRLCADRACATVVQTVMTTASQVQPTTTLPSGVVFWQVTGLDATGASVWSSATWDFVAPRRDAPIDTAWGVSHDYNGDGFADIAVANDFYANSSGMFTGKAYVYLGRSGGVEASYGWSFEGTAINMDVGDGIAGVGDINNDGYGDLLVGDPGANIGLGQAYLFEGSSGSPPFDAPLTWSAPTDPGIFPPEFGGNASSAGDVNGDGFSDFMFSSVESGGRAYIGLGGIRGIGPLTYLDGSSYSTIAGGASAFGYATSSTGDLDGDGYGDLVVGAHAFDAGDGLALVYFGGPEGVAATPGIEINPPSGCYGFFGAAVAGVGDLNGDNLADLAIGCEYAAAVYYGRADRSLDLGVVLISPDPHGGSPGESFGTSISTPGDLNGDGYSDLIVGGGIDGVDGNGRVYVYLGGPVGVSSVPSFELEGNGMPQYFGISLSCPGDLNGDGLDDLVVGANAMTGGSGSFNVFYGSAGVLSSTPDYEQTSPDSSFADFFGIRIN